jgi:hypothetical protein
MGLDFCWEGDDTIDSNETAYWSYLGFHRFRKRLAEEIGVDLDKMEGFGENEDGAVPWSITDDPIVPLLDHSDCDGELTPDLCAEIAPRLRELVANWPDDYDKRNAILLADSMDTCARLDVSLEFC